MTLVFLGVLWLALGATQPTPGGDTVGWEDSAAQLHGWRDVFATQRPPLYPLLIRAAGYSHAGLVAIQTVLYAAAWTALAASLWRGRRLLAALVFYIALFPGFADWTPVVMTESVSISLSVLAFACLIRFLDGARWAIWSFVGLTILRCFLRNFDVLFCLMDILLLAALVAVRVLDWRSCVVLSLALGACGIFFARFGGYADYTWYFALLSDIGIRVLPDPARLRFFIVHGMPISSALLSMSGHWAWENHWRFFKPDLAPFRDWLRLHGRETYAAYWLRHPVETITMMWRQRDLVFQPGGVPHWYFASGTRYGVPPWPPFGVVYGVVSAGLILGAVQWGRGALARPLVAPLVVAIALAVMPVPAAFAAFYADPSDVPRHCLPILLQAALAMLLLARVACDLWADRAWRLGGNGPRETGEI